ncbi:MAG: carboxymuconolactone decarboxylase family protein [Alphaproteobacteria bacterium]
MTATEKNFPLHEIETAPEAARPILEGAKKGFGMVPNLHKVLAEAPAALEGYATLWGIFEKSSFTPAERQVVYLTSNYENECCYCMAGHSVLAKGAGVPADAIEAIRDGKPIADAKLEALRAFTSKIVVNRGWVAEDEVAAFLAAGYTRQQVLEVILGVAVKVISNYTNHVAETPLDGFMKDTVWTPPAKRERAA